MQDCIAKRFAGGCLLVLAVACGEEEIPRAVPIDVAVADCISETVSPEDQASKPDEEACALLCRVPGGVDECPVGTPCPAASSNEIDSRTALHANLCARANPGEQSCFPSSAR